MSSDLLDSVMGSKVEDTQLGSRSCAQTHHQGLPQLFPPSSSHTWVDSGPLSSRKLTALLLWHRSPLFWDPHQLLWGLDRLLQGKGQKAPSGRGIPRLASAVLISQFLSPPLPAMWPDRLREGRQVYKFPCILPSLAANALNFMDSISLFLAIKSQDYRA